MKDKYEIIKGPEDTFIYISYNPKTSMHQACTRRHYLYQHFNYVDVVEFTYKYLYQSIPERKKRMILKQELNKGFGNE